MLARELYGFSKRSIREPPPDAGCGGVADKLDNQANTTVNFDGLRFADLGVHIATFLDAVT